MESLEKPQILVYTEITEEEWTLFDCKWIPCSARFVTLGSDTKGSGVIAVYSFGKELKLSVKGGESFPSFKCGTFGASSLDSRNLATGDFKGNLRIWDLEMLSTPKESFKSAHEDLINCIDGCKTSREILTGSRDGSVKVWDIRSPEKPVSCMIPREDQIKRDCWTAVFGSEGELVAAGYDNGDIKVFDLRNMKLYWETHLPNGVCSLEFDRQDLNPPNKLGASCLEGRIHFFDTHILHPERGFAEASYRCSTKSTTLWSLNHLPQNRDVFSCAAGSGNISLYRYQYPDKRVKENEEKEPEGVAGSIVELQDTTVGDQPINALDWSKDKLGLAVCTAFDKKIRIVIATKLNTL